MPELGQDRHVELMHGVGDPPIDRNDAVMEIREGQRRLAVIHRHRMPGDDDAGAAFRPLAQIVDIGVRRRAVRRLVVRGVPGIHDPVAERVAADGERAEQVGKGLGHPAAPGE